MIEISYYKHNNHSLFEQFSHLEENKILHTQNYIPLYTKFFSITKKNWNSFNLNHTFHITSIQEQQDKNHFMIEVENYKTKDKETKDAFFKFSPILDPIKYIGGKYHNIEREILYTLPEFNNPSVFEKYADPNNVAYVDSFFSFLSSQLKDMYHFDHGISFYGSFLGIQNKFHYDISDDIEYLENSKFFHEHKGGLFDLDLNYYQNMDHFRTMKYKEKLHIHNTAKISCMDPTEDISLNMLFQETKSKTFKNETLKTYYRNDTQCSRESMTSTTSSCSSKDSETSCSSQEEEDGDEDHTSQLSELTQEDDVESEYEEYDTEITATIHKFPVQIICIEKLSNTLDHHIKEHNYTIPLEEWKSILCQILMILLTYQKCFDFTHNDLHSNNIMYEETTKTHLYYRYNGIFYSVPTFGKIYKIIDFGRSIYKYKNVQICSDNYKKGEDAHTQYNFGVYYNKNKPVIEPNKAFDLCRLGCSLIDYFIEDYTEIDNVERNEIVDLVLDWCNDDKGRNILYKRNGEERFAGFKLYKMIARITHHQTPQHEIGKEVFKEYRRENIDQPYMDIDGMKVQYG